MGRDEKLSEHEELAIEEADAWFEYLEVTRAEVGSGRYLEVESWAWDRLSERLWSVRRRRRSLERAVA